MNNRLLLFLVMTISNMAGGALFGPYLVLSVTGEELHGASLVIVAVLGAILGLVCASGLYIFSGRVHEQRRVGS